MIKDLCPENERVFLGGNMIKFTHQGDWLLSLVDDNGLLEVVVIPNIIFLPEDGRIFILP